jgi:hypothetical protein
MRIGHHILTVLSIVILLASDCLSMTDHQVNKEPIESQVEEVPASSWSSYLFSKAKSTANSAYESATGATKSVDWQEMQSQASSTAALIGETGMTGLGVITDKIVQTETYNKVDEWAYQNRKEIVVGALLVGTAVVMPGVALAVAKPIVVGAMGNTLNKMMAAQRPLDIQPDETDTNQQSKL